MSTISWILCWDASMIKSANYEFRLQRCEWSIVIWGKKNQDFGKGGKGEWNEKTDKAHTHEKINIC